MKELAPKEGQRIKLTPRRGEAVVAQFNPASLQYTITNSAARGSAAQTDQRVDDTKGKLTMELVFDSTHDGHDVRRDTEKVARMMKPQNRVPPIVDIEWGEFKFSGNLDQYRETVDFFSVDGIPLRATLSLGFTTVAQNNKTPSTVFDFASGKAPSPTSAAAPGSPDSDSGQPSLGVGGAGRGGASGSAVDAPTASTDSTTDVARRAGDTSRGRDIARANGVEDIRNPGTSSLVVSDQPTLLPPIGFAPAPDGGDGGGGVSLGVALGPSAAGGGAGTGAPVGNVAGGRASAGVTATAGAFALLRVPSAQPRRPVDLGRLVGAGAPAPRPAGAGARFAFGGRALSEVPAGFSADVGAGAAARIDEEV